MPGLTTVVGLVTRVRTVGRTPVRTFGVGVVFGAWVCVEFVPVWPGRLMIATDCAASWLPVRVPLTRTNEPIRMTLGATIWLWLWMVAPVALTVMRPCGVAITKTPAP